MIFTVKLRNIVLSVLLLLSVSFLYIGYLNANSTTQLAEEVTEVSGGISEGIQSEIQGIKATDEAPLLVDYSAGNSDVQGEIAAAKPVENDKEDYFFQARLDRERSADKEIEVLNEIINHPDSSTEMISDAQKKMMQLTERNTLTTQGESMLKAKGYEHVVILLESDKATVVVDNTNLSDDDMVKIGDIVHRSTNYGLDQIVIIPK